MAEPTIKKQKRFWEVDCGVCETTMTMEAVVILNIEKTAEFIVVPRYFCGKCRSECIVELVEKEEKPPEGVKKK